MNSYRTEIQKHKANFTISHRDSIMLIGSCFAESIGGRLINSKFPVDINPFGILFNPMSISQGLNILTDDEFTFKESDLHFYYKKWISFFHHGKFSNSNRETALETINKRLVEGREFLKKANILILTLGTNASYIREGNIVANCHKVPQTEFERKNYTNQVIVPKLRKSIEKLRDINNDIQVIFTVSPIRNIKENMGENMRSKAELIITAHRLIGYLNDSSYFPAFEIMMDDLRDYRFYADDMIHPSKTANNYIWDIFSNTFFSRETKKLNEKIRSINLAMSHIIKDHDSEGVKEFKEIQLKKIEHLHNEYPNLSFDMELDYFNGI